MDVKKSAKWQVCYDWSPTLFVYTWKTSGALIMVAHSPSYGFQNRVQVEAPAEPSLE